MVVVTISERDLNRCRCQPTGTLKTGEPPADNQNPGSLCEAMMSTAHAVTSRINLVMHTPITNLFS